MFWRTRTETCFWRHILDQKQDGIHVATRKRERNQKIVFSLWRVQSSTFLKIYGVIKILAKENFFYFLQSAILKQSVTDHQLRFMFGQNNDIIAAQPKSQKSFTSDRSPNMFLVRVAKTHPELNWYKNITLYQSSRYIILSEILPSFRGQKGIVTSCFISFTCCNEIPLTLLLLQQGSESVKIWIYFPKVYLLHLKVKHCQTLCVYINRLKWVDCFWLVLFRVVKMTVKTSQKCPCVHIWFNSQNRQLTGFDPYSNFWLKCSNSRRVNLYIVQCRLEFYFCPYTNVCISG